jgi:phenylpyruvate tautomerase PptA (4-oxalocrotonate tautomerase family)
MIINIPIPDEILYEISSHLCVKSLYEAGFICKLWKKLSERDVLWKNHYKKCWFTDKIVENNRPWKTIYFDRLNMENQILTNLKRDELMKTCVEKIEQLGKRFTSEKELLFLDLRYDIFIAYGDYLKEISFNETKNKKVLLYLIAGEQYSTAVAKKANNYVAYFNWGYTIHNLIRDLPKEIAEDLYKSCFEKYNLSISSPDNVIKDEVYSRWGDTLHDYAKTKKTKAEVEELLYQSYDKLDKSVNVIANYMAYDNWGIALHTHAKIKRNYPDEADSLYEQCYEKFKKASELKPEDGYIYSHHASALQSQALQKDGESSLQIFELSFKNYKNSIQYLPQDSYIYRSWGDALHDCSKKLLEGL